MKYFRYVHDIAYIFKSIYISEILPIYITEMTTVTAAQVTMKIHRYEFSELAMMQLNYFTQVHRYDERKAFKEAWKKWVETAEIAEMIETETARLVNDGFTGDVEDKMFKAVRYYFRKKPVSSPNELGEQTPRKKYVGFTGKILTAMDEHIIARIKENLCKIKENTIEKIKYKSNVSPEKAFADFYNTNQDIICEEAKLLKEEEEYMDNTDIELKIKKTYKNRYQTIRKKLADIEVNV